MHQTRLPVQRNAPGTTTRDDEQPWQMLAACRDVQITADADPFYAPAGVPEKSYDWSDARALCASCPVLTECLGRTLDEETETTAEGFRAGFTAARRRTMLRKVRRVTRPMRR